MLPGRQRELAVSSSSFRSSAWLAAKPSCLQEAIVSPTGPLPKSRRLRDSVSAGRGSGIGSSGDGCLLPGIERFPADQRICTAYLTADPLTSLVWLDAPSTAGLPNTTSVGLLAFTSRLRDLGGSRSFGADRRYIPRFRSPWGEENDSSNGCYDRRAREKDWGSGRDESRQGRGVEGEQAEARREGALL